jgi:hypothetical protein
MNFDFDVARYIAFIEDLGVWVLWWEIPAF